MITKSQSNIDLVSKLALVIQTRKDLEKEEKSLKEEVRAIMGDELILDAGDFCVLVSERSRSDLDKDAIMHDLGKPFFDKYSKRSTYETLEVKAKARKETFNVG